MFLVVAACSVLGAVPLAAVAAALSAASAIGCNLLCRNPFVKGIEPYPCGQCMPCRINRRRVWSHRLMLESHKHGSSVFATFTYAPENVPACGSLCPRDVQLWLKRFRKEIGFPIRYYFVGEYGDETFRPHYHAALFGVGLEYQEVAQKTWGFGFVHFGELTIKSAQYIAGYVTKKMTKKDDPRLKGLHPEFARMSLRPGIGASAMVDVASALNDREGAAEVNRLGDVPGLLRHGPKKLPLGRYLKRRLRNELGAETDGAQIADQARIEELRALRKSSGSRSVYEVAKPFVDWQASDKVIFKDKLFKKKGML